MKTMDVGDRNGLLSRCVELARDGTVLILRDGRPAALITNVEGYDLEDIATASSPEFWRMIENRRTQPTVSREELEWQLQP